MQMWTEEKVTHNNNTKEIIIERNLLYTQFDILLYIYVH